MQVAQDVNLIVSSQQSFGDGLADRVAQMGGSWTFICVFVGFLIAWAVLNSLLLVRYGPAFDPYPYIFLNLILSMVAALQAPVILMSQNRQAARDRVAASLDYEVNLKAEVEIMALHEKLDRSRLEHLEAAMQGLMHALSEINARLVIIQGTSIPFDATAARASAEVSAASSPRAPGAALTGSPAL